MKLKAFFECDFCKKELAVNVMIDNKNNIVNPLKHIVLPSYGDGQAMATTNVHICPECAELLRHDLDTIGYRITDWYGVTISTPKRKDSML